MAANVIHSDSISLTFSKNTGNIQESSCKKCIDYESQLCEALDELGSARKIIEILQKELSIYPPANATCGSVQISPKASGKPIYSTKWTLVPARNYSPNPKNSKKHIAAASNQTIKMKSPVRKNNNTRKLPQPQPIPVIVNRYAPLDSLQEEPVASRNHNRTSEKPKLRDKMNRLPKTKKRKVIII
jgi:hypothetical protein